MFCAVNLKTDSLKWNQWEMGDGIIFSLPTSPTSINPSIYSGTARCGACLSHFGRCYIELAEMLGAPPVREGI